MKQTRQRQAHKGAKISKPMIGQRQNTRQNNRLPKKTPSVLDTTNRKEAAGRNQDGINSAAGLQAPAADTGEKLSLEKPGTIAAPRPSRTAILIALMQVEGGASIDELAAAVGWQKHSVRGFIAGTLKKRRRLTISANKRDGAMYYAIAPSGSDRSRS